MAINIYMNDHRDAVDNTLDHLDNITGTVWTWYEESRRWDRELGLQICRTDKGDSIMFQYEQEYLIWLLRFS